METTLHRQLKDRYAIEGALTEQRLGRYRIDVVQPGQAILSVYDLSHLWVTANLEETKIAAIRLHDSVDIALDAHPGRRFVGEITMIRSGGGIGVLTDSAEQRVGQFHQGHPAHPRPDLARRRGR